MELWHIRMLASNRDHGSDLYVGIDIVNSYSL